MTGVQPFTRSQSPSASFDPIPKTRVDVRDYGSDPMARPRLDLNLADGTRLAARYMFLAVPYMGRLSVR